MPDLGTATGTIELVYQGGGAVQQATSDLQALSTVGKTLLGIGGAAAAPLVGAAKSAIDFGEQMANVNSILQLSDDGIAKLSQDVLDMAGNVTQAPTELASALYDINSAGFSGQEGLDILNSAALAANAGLTDVNTSADVLSGTINAYGQQSTAAAHDSDVLFQTVNDGVITFGELADHMGRVTPLASSLGVTLEDVGAAYATMTQRNISASQAETDMQALMTAAIKPTKGMTAALADYNVNGEHFATVADLIQKQGFLGYLQFLREASGGTADGMAKLTGNVRATNGALALTNDNLKLVTEEEQRMQHASDGLGATQRAFAKQQESVSFALKTLQVEMQRAAITLGSVLEPAIAKAAFIGADFFKAFADAPPIVRDFTAAFLATVAGISTFAGTAILAYVQLQKLNTALETVGLSIAKVGTIAVGAGLVIGAAILAYETNFLGFRDLVNGVLKSAGDAFGRFQKGFQAAFTANRAAGVNRVSAALEGIGAGLANMANGEGPLNAIGEGFVRLGQAVDVVENTFTDFRNNGLNPVAAGVLALGEGFKFLTSQETVPDFFLRATDAAQNFGDTFEKATRVLESMDVSPTAAKIQALGIALKAATGIDLTDFFTRAANAVQIFQNSMDQLTAQGVNPFRAAVIGGAEALKQLTGIDIIPFAIDVANKMDDIGQGLDNNVIPAVKRFGQTLLSGDFQGALQQLSDGLGQAIQTAANAVTSIDIPSLIVNIGTWAIGRIQDLGQWIHDNVLAGGINLGQIAANIGSWLISAAQDFGTAVKNFVTGSSQPLSDQPGSGGITLGSIAATISGWVISAAQNIWDAVKAFIFGTGAGVNSMGGPGERGEAGAQVTLGSVAATVAGWVISQTADIFGEVTKFAVNLVKNIPLGTIAATISGWVISAAQSIGDAIRQFVSGGSVNSMGGPGERGEAGGGIDLGQIAANVGSWLISAAQNVWDAITTFAKANLPTIQLGDIAAQVGQWLISAAQDIGSAIQAFIGGGGINSMGGPGERGEAGTEITIPSVAAQIETWVISAAQSIGDAIQAFIGGVGGGDKLGASAGLGGVAGQGITIQSVAASIQSWAITAIGDFSQAVQTELAGNGPVTFDDLKLSITTPNADNITIDVGGIIGAIAGKISSAFEAPTAEDQFKAGLKGTDLGAKFGQWIVDQFKAGTGPQGGPGGGTDTADMLTVAEQFVDNFVIAVAGQIGPAIDNAIQAKNAELTADVNTAVQKFWDWLGTTLSTAWSVGAGGVNSMGGPGERGEPGTQPQANVAQIMGTYIGNFMSGVGTAISDAFATAQEKLPEIYTTIYTSVQNIWQGIQDALNSAMEKGASGFGQFGFQGHGPSPGVTGFGNAISGWVENIVTSIYDAFKDIPNQIKAKLGTISWDGIFDPVKDGLTKALDAVTSSGVWKWLFPAGSAEAAGLDSKGQTSTDGAAMGKAFADSLAKAFQSPDFQSALTAGLQDLPSSAFTASGAALFQKMTQGISEAMASRPATEGGQVTASPFAQNIMAGLASSLAAAIPAVPAETFQQVGSQLMQKITEGIGIALNSAGAGGAGGQIAGSGDMAGAGANISNGIVTSIATSLAVAVSTVSDGVFAPVGQALMSKITAGINSALSGAGAGPNSMGGPGERGEAGTTSGLGQSIVTSIVQQLTSSVSAVGPEVFAPIGQMLMSKIQEALTSLGQGGGAAGGPGGKAGGGPGGAGAGIGQALVSSILQSVQGANFAAVGQTITQQIGASLGATASTVVQAMQAVITTAIQAASTAAATAQTVGTAIDTAVGQGIGAGAGTVTAAVGAMISVAISAGNTAAAGAQAIGTAFDTATGQGIGANAGTLTGAVSAMVQVGIDAGVGAAAGASAIGAAISSGAAAGVDTSALEGPVAAMVANGLAAGKAAAGIASPSKVARDEIGVPIGQGTTQGVEQTAPDVATALSTAISDAIAAAEAQLKQDAGALGNSFGNSIAQGMDQATPQVSQAAGDMTKQASGVAQRAIDHANALRQKWTGAAQQIVSDREQWAQQLQHNLEVNVVVDDRQMGRYVIGKTIAPLASAFDRVGSRTGHTG